MTCGFPPVFVADYPCLVYQERMTYLREQEQVLDQSKQSTRKQTGPYQLEIPVMGPLMPTSN
jgi:hypothetical protein